MAHNISRQNILTYFVNYEFSINFQVLTPLSRPMIVPTSEKLIFFGGGDCGAEFKDDIDRFLR